jgi:hypothetical protein
MKRLFTGGSLNQTIKLQSSMTTTNKQPFGDCAGRCRPMRHRAPLHAGFTFTRAALITRRAKKAISYQYCRRAFRFLGFDHVDGFK